MNVFYSPELTETDSSVTLSKEESIHVLKSLRLQKDAQVCLSNGNGLKAEGIISGTAGGCCIIDILQVESIPVQKFRLHLAVAPPKNHDRFEWFVEKASELGVSVISPLICRHSERKRIHAERLQRILVAAMKQSQGFFLPKITNETTFNDLVTDGFSGQSFIAVCNELEIPHLKEQLKKNTDVRILIGPEGDFSEEEKKLAKTNAYKPISLGRKRLRTETAAIAACHIFNLINEP